MPVTFTVSSAIEAKRKQSDNRHRSDVDIFDAIWGETNTYQELLQSTFSSGYPKAHDVRIGGKNGFLNTVIYAWNQHHNLILKPDDLWIAILTQFNFYVNAHAEELRSKFVTHEGRKDLIVEDIGTRYSLDFGKLAARLTTKIQENVLDPDLQVWVLPDFTTTTFNDTVVCSVTMMATFKHYFRYIMRAGCGIPQITLLGVKEDWEKLLKRIDKLESFGEEPAAWASLLRPVLTRFMDAFNGNYNPDFWNTLVHAEPSSMSGKTGYLSGWIAHFCVWDRKGTWLGPQLPLSNADMARNLPCHRLAINSLPPSICEVDVILDDNGEIFDCVMVAGHIGGVATGELLDTLGMVPAWFMAVKSENDELEFEPWRMSRRRLRR